MHGKTAGIFAAGDYLPSRMPDAPATEQYWTDRNGSRLCYAEYGEPGGKPFFYFHGWPSSRLQAAIMDEEAKRLGLRIISPDRPGMGRSDFVGKRTLAEWPEVVEGLADHLGISSFPVLGVSGGGPYALACAAWLPARVDRVSVVCGAPPLGEFSDHSDLLWVYRLMLKVRDSAPWLLEKVMGLAGAMSYLPTNRPPMSWLLKSIPPEDRDAVMSAGGYETFFGNLRESVSQGGKGPVADADVYLDDWALDFSSIRVPVIFWHGALDRNIPLRMAKEVASRVPAVETRWLENEGHYSLPLRQMRPILEDLAGC